MITFIIEVILSFFAAVILLYAAAMFFASVIVPAIAVVLVSIGYIFKKTWDWL